MRLKVYGCRGTVAMSSSLCTHYGGNTSCLLVEVDGKGIIFDAGSGILNLDSDMKQRFENYPEDPPFRPEIFISHLHLDHIIGLTNFSPLYTKETKARLYTMSRDSRPLKEQVMGAFVPPYWPVPLENLAQAEFIEIYDGVPYELDAVTITPFLAKHPDMTLSYHITDGKKILVHLLDNEVCAMDTKQYRELVDFCKDADLVVFDSAYSAKDYKAKRGWGHSTVDDGVKLANDCGCKKMMFSHFSPHYSDTELNEWAEALGSDPRFIFACDGMEIEI